jgi:putative oxidoreductase
MPCSRLPEPDVTGSRCNDGEDSRDRSNVIAALLDTVFAPTPRWASLAAATVRVASGAIFVGFGLSKFAHHVREARAFARYGLPDPGTFAYSTGTLELTLGAALVLGLFTRPAAFGLAGNMIGAIATGGRVDGGLVNLVLSPILLVAMLFLVYVGAGRWSLDDRLRLWAVRSALRLRLGPAFR